MGCRQKINERTTSAGGQIKAAIRELAPSHPLPNQKSASEHHSDPEPGKTFALSERDAWDGTNRRESRLPCNLSPSQFRRNTAHQQ